MITIQMPSEAPHLHYSHSDSCGRTADSGIVPPPDTTPSTSQRQNMISSLPNACSTDNGDGSSSNCGKRPKLSLQTSSLPMTFGKSTTALSLSLATGPTSSPTVANTFNNAFDVSRTDRPTNTTLSTSIPRSRRSRQSSPYRGNQHLTHEDHPYRMPAGIRSILRNSPIPKSSLRQSSVSRTTTSSSTGETGRRAFFPSRKQVSYRFPLEEEIKTVTFVAKHSDILPSESTSTSATTSSDGSGSDEDYDVSASDSGSTPSDEETSAGSRRQSRRKRRKGSNGLSEKQIHAAALRDGLVVRGKEEDYGQGTPQSPFLYGHRKRRREWRWTLGPLAPDEAQIPAQTDQDHHPPQLHFPKPKIGEVLSIDTAITAATTGDQSREELDTDTDSIHTVASYVPLPDSLGSSPGVGPSCSFEELAMSPEHTS